MAAPGLVIFDCDGVLVDSEPISVEVLREVLADAGCEISVETAYERMLGLSIGSVSEMVRRDYGLDLTGAHLADIRTRLYARFRRDLHPVPGVAQAIRALSRPVCVASSSQPERIALSLEVTGLAPLFGPHVFSATMVSRGKPAPDLFLHAAREMGVAPRDCVVVEDSLAGIEAAQAAGMRVVAFTGGAHAGPARLANRAKTLGPTAQVDNMAALADILLTQL
ncbi:HAD-IA family hydrolase [Pseudooceanicola sp. 216_PA32_1]|uniref:HAD-IA family hydrolase n=1 Tax=Pseudooceanicola pacificus TaxID=2676438 RepID=A0A844W734_9RHOB|nr:HAD-IA family hydrolase [Pseudooceanicola pacificus]